MTTLTGDAESKRMRHVQPGIYIGGLGLFLIGVWLLALASGLPLVGFDRLWPAIPIIAGLAMLTQYALENRKRSGLIFFGVAALLTGSFLCLFSFQIGRLAWSDMIRYWQTSLLILGAAFMMLYLADGMRDEGLLRPAYVLGGFGLLALPFSLRIVRGVFFDQVARLWPLLLIPVLLLLFFRLRSRNRGGQAG